MPLREVSPSTLSSKGLALTERHRDDSLKLGAALLGFRVKQFLRDVRDVGKQDTLIKQRNGDGVEALPVVCPERPAVAAFDLGKGLPSEILLPRVAWRREGHRVGGQGAAMRLNDARMKLDID